MESHLLGQKHKRSEIRVVWEEANPMQKTRRLRYLIFLAMFAAVLVGLLAHSYIVLSVLVVLAILLGIVGDVIENKPTAPFKQYNELHDHHVKIGE